MSKLNANVQNILSVYYGATVQERVDGLSWYRAAHTIAVKLSERYHVTIGVAAGVIAALSPRNNWTRNVTDAENMIAAAYHKLPYASVKVCTFGRNKQKSIDILEGVPVRDVLTGNKTLAFWQNICDPDSLDGTVCVDGHAYSIWSGVRTVLAKTPNLTGKLYATIAADYVTASLHINAYTDEYVLPCDVQAITWCSFRATHGIK